MLHATPRIRVYKTYKYREKLGVSAVTFIKASFLLPRLQQMFVCMQVYRSVRRGVLAPHTIAAYRNPVCWLIAKKVGILSNNHI